MMILCDEVVSDILACQDMAKVGRTAAAGRGVKDGVVLPPATV